MRPAHTETYDASHLQCPNPFCRSRVGPRRVLLGAFVDRCTRCGQWFLARAALGVADVNGLTEEQGERYSGQDVTGRLAELLREIGVVRHRPPAERHA